MPVPINAVPQGHGGRGPSTFDKSTSLSLSLSLGTATVTSSVVVFFKSLASRIEREGIKETEMMKSMELTKLYNK